MKTGVFEIDGRVRVAVQVPDSALRVDLSKAADESIPIVIVGDSSRHAAMRLGYAMLCDMGYSSWFLLDMLLVNGNGNRYLKCHVDIKGEWTMKSGSEFEMSEALHSRCNRFQASLLDKADCHVLPEVALEAVKNDTLPMPKR